MMAEIIALLIQPVNGNAIKYQFKKLKKLYHVVLKSVKKTIPLLTNGEKNVIILAIRSTQEPN